MRMRFRRCECVMNVQYSRHSKHSPLLHGNWQTNKKTLLTWHSPHCLIRRHHQRCRRICNNNFSIAKFPADNSTCSVFFLLFSAHFVSYLICREKKTRKYVGKKYADVRCSFCNENLFDSIHRSAKIRRTSTEYYDSRWAGGFAHLRGG